MKRFVAAVALAVVLTTPAPAQRVSQKPLVDNREWTVRANRHVVATITRSKRQLLPALRKIRNNESGEVLVRIEILVDRNGRIIASNVKQSSGYEEIDRAVQRIVARLGPFPRVPPSIGSEGVRLTVAIKLRNVPA